MSTSHQIVDVPRFVRRYGEASVAGDGFLPDPDDRFAPYRQRNALRLDEVLQGPCTVILGEPGLGKTTALEAHLRALPAGAVSWSRPPPPSAYAGPEFDAWTSGRAPLHLTIDGIDEVTTAAFLDELPVLLRRGSLDNLRLELACRAAEWPPTLDQELRRLFGDRFRCFVLEPLRLADAAAIADTNGVDSEGFLREVRERNLEPLASRPLTLRMLLALSRNGPLPIDAATVYEHACEVLCQEHNKVRRERHRHHRPTATALLEAAEWLAAGMMFTGHHHVSPNPEDLGEGRLSIDTLIDALPEHDRSTVQPLLDSGLFTVDGDGDWAWVHQSFAEYLAARWLRRLPAKQQRQLMSHQAADPPHVPRALWGVASWSCRLDRDAASWLATTFPESLLLAASPSLAPPDALERATAALLSRSGRIPGLHPWWPRTRLENLDHPRLGAQLGEVLTRDERPVLERRIAIDIARANESPQALDYLVVVALDPTRPAGERAAAVRAAWDIAGDDHDDHDELADRLRPLVDEDRHAKSDDVKTALIERMWPAHLTIDELLVLLGPPRRNVILGSYVAALHKVATHLPGPALPATLHWLAQRPPVWGARQSPSFEMRRFAIEVVEGGVHRLDEPEVAAAMGRAVGELLEAYAQVLDRGRHPVGDWRRDPRRLALVEAVVEHSRRWDEGYRLFHPNMSPPLLFADEHAWIVAKHEASAAPQRERWASLIRHVISFTQSLTTDHVRFIEYVVERHLEGEAVLPCPPFESLNGELAIAVRKARASEERVRRADAAREAGTLPLRETALRVLAGEPAPWTTCVLQHAARLGHDTRFDAERALDLPNAAPSVADLVLQASRSYLKEIDLHEDDWLGVADVRCGHVEGGVMLLILLHEHDPDWLVQQSAAFWEKWIPAVISVSTSLEYLPDDQPLQRFQRLLGHCWDAAPQLVCRVLGDLLEQGYLPSNLVAFTALPPSPQLDDILAHALASPSTDHFTRVVAAVLLKRNPGRAEGIVALHLHPDDPHPHAGTLVDTILEIGSPEVWSLMWRRSAHLAWKITSAMASTPSDARRDNLLRDLPEAMLTDVYRWSVDEHPGVRDDDDFDDIVRLRHAVGSALAARGTPSAVERLQRLRERYPQQDDLHRRVAEAEHHRLEATWQRPPLRALFAMPSRADLHVVRSADELLDAVCDALEMYQHRLHGSFNEVDALWSNDGGRSPTYWPKSELTLSKHVANRLCDLLSASVHDEVEVKPRSGAAPGERTDILVVSRDGSREHRVVIEVKCQWNDALMTGLRDQLVDRYLASQPGAHGIYLVAWFHSPMAAPKAQSKLRRWPDRLALFATLSEQAALASTPNRRIRYVPIDASLEPPPRIEEQTT